MNKYTIALLLVIAFLKSACDFDYTYNKCISSAKLKHKHYDHQLIEALSNCAAKFEERINLMESLEINITGKLHPNRDTFIYLIQNQSKNTTITRITFHLELARDEILKEKIEWASGLKGASNYSKKMIKDIAIEILKKENLLEKWNYDVRFNPTIDVLSNHKNEVKIHTDAAESLRNNQYSNISYSLYGVQN